TREYYGSNGLNVPGVTTLEGDPMGGWIQYSFGPTVSAWLGHHFYLHWRYTMDREFLKNDAYPWIREVALFLKELSVLGKDGKRKLPLSSSPEIHNNDARAWFDQMTNYDLALVRWTFTTASELALELGYQDEAEEWNTILAEWPDYAIDETGLLVAPGEPLKESHRHFSQVMAIHPLSLINPSNGEKDREIIDNTIARLDALGSSNWTGYSFAWLGNLKARAHDGNGAAKALRDFASSFVLPNSFHVNGDQSGTGKSNFTYRPFTLEGNFAFAAGIQEMLIQSHTGVVKLLPAIPLDWQEISFTNLRTEGAFLVSATMGNGKVEKLEITSEKGGELAFENPFGNDEFTADKEYLKDGQLIKLNF
ncbi:MAG: glycoside hydrolase family 95-like protein, partial [Cyclobacteriaceae bacterium]